MTTVTEQKQVQSIGDIPGWFPWVDQRVFERFLDDEPPHGDLVELGVYLGKSAALIGKHVRAGETFTVCDLFGGQALDDSNREENRKSYANLSRAQFERNYLAINDQLPVIIEDLSSVILDHVKPGSARFVHVDASHLYEHVAIDVDSTRTMLLPDGVVAFDDYRSAHTPGVSAAVWEAVFAKGLRPICVTTQKLYGTFGDPGPHRERIESWLQSFGRVSWEVQSLAGVPVLRIGEPRKPAAAAKPADVGRLATTTQEGMKQLSADVSKLGTSMDRRMSSLEREIIQLRRSRGSAVERGLRRAARTVRARRA